MPSDRITRPHGGTLIQQHSEGKSDEELAGITYIEIDEKCESDVKQISEGTYSPIESFMNYEKLMSVLQNNKLPNGSIWTLPILMQLNKAEVKRLPHKGQIGLKSKKSSKIFAFLYIEAIEKLESMPK